MYRQNKNCSTGWAVILLLLNVVACGGGGGEAEQNTETSVLITVANASAVATEAITYPEFILEFLFNVISDIKDHPPANSNASSGTLCASGATETVSFNSSQVVAGTTFAAMYDNCSFSGSTINGAIAIGFNAGTSVMFNEFVGSILFDALLFSNYGGSQLDGALNFRINFNNAGDLLDFEIASGALVFQGNTNNAMLESQRSYNIDNIDFERNSATDATTLALDVDIDSDVLNRMSVRASSTSLMATFGDYATSLSGSIVVTGGSNSSLTISGSTANSSLLGTFEVNSGDGMLLTPGIVPTWQTLMASSTSNFLIPNGG